MPRFSGVWHGSRKTRFGGKHRAKPVFTLIPQSASTPNYQPRHAKKVAIKPSPFLVIRRIKPSPLLRRR